MASLGRQGSNTVRLIGGAWRGRLLRFPSVPGLRPTPDRVRETLFNWLGQSLDGLRCLDLFAGSGALGFEAVSRGASEVVLVEHDGKAAQALRANAELLGARQVRVVQVDGAAYLQRGDDRYDVVFLDPPFDSGLLPGILDKVATRLAPGGKIYAESPRPVSAEGWTVLRETRAGRSHSFLLERA